MLSSTSDTRHFAIDNIPPEFADPECWSQAREQKHYKRDMARLRYEFSKIEPARSTRMSAEEEKEMLNAKLKRANSRASGDKGEQEKSKVNEPSARVQGEKAAAKSLLDVVAMAFQGKKESEKQPKTLTPSTSKPKLLQTSQSVGGPADLAMRQEESPTKPLASDLRSSASVGGAAVNTYLLTRGRLSHEGRPESANSTATSVANSELDAVLPDNSAFPGHPTSESMAASTCTLQERARSSGSMVKPTARPSKERMLFERGELKTSLSYSSQDDQPEGSVTKSPTKSVRPPRKMCSASAGLSSGRSSSEGSAGAAQLSNLSQQAQPRAFPTLDSSP